MDNINLLEILACPKCRKKLEIDNKNNKMICINCGSIYDTIDDIPVLIKVEELNNFKKKESNFHSTIANNADRAHSLHSLRVKYLHNDFLHPLRTELPINSLVIDVACGSGIDLITLCNDGYSVIGADISFGMCKVTFDKIKETNLNKRALVCQADAESLPFSSDLFDAAYISASLHHFKNPNFVLKEMKRVVKPGGFVIIGSEPNSWPYRFRRLKYSNLGKKILRIFRKDYTIGGGSPADYETEGFSKKNLAKLAYDARLEILDIKPIWYINGFISLLGIVPPTKLEKMFILLDTIISRIPYLKNYSWKWNMILSKKRDE